MSRMEFDVSTLGYIQNTQSIILDYAISIKNLHRRDRLFDAGALGNFSLAGFEMVKNYIKFFRPMWKRKFKSYLQQKQFLFNINLTVLQNNLNFLLMLVTKNNCKSKDKCFTLVCT